MARTARRVVEGASKLTALGGAVVVTLMLVMIVSDVVMRVATGAGVRGSVEYIETLVVLVAFLGISEAERTGQHVAVDVVTARLSPTWALRVRRFAIAVALAITGLLCYGASSRAINAVAAREVRFGLLQLPLWPLRILIATCLFLLFLQLLLTMAKLYGAGEMRRSDTAEA